MGPQGPILVAAAALMGCAAAEAVEAELSEPAEITYLDAELVSVAIEADGRPTPEALRALSDCALAEALLEGEAGYARHVRTNITEGSGISRADAVYTVSTEPPRGEFVIVAQERAAQCRAAETTGV